MSILKEHVTSIFRAEEKTKQETILLSCSSVTSLGILFVPSQVIPLLYLESTLQYHTVGLVNCIMKPQKYILLPCFLREYSEIIFVLFCSLNGNCTRGTEEDYPRTNGDVTGSPALCCNGALIHGDDCRRQMDEDEDHLAADWGRTVAGVKEQAFARLQEELNKAHQELRLRDEEVNRLSRVREEVEAELEELTASLFQVRGPHCSLQIVHIVENRLTEIHH
jgi:hypothetical protein